jgi:hypothetical protein
MAHLQYARWAVSEHALDDADRDKLKEHAALRKVRGWGSGFEHAFYVKEDLDAATDKAIRDNLLSQTEAEAERQILTALASKLDPILEQHAPALEAFRTAARAIAPKIAPLADKVTRLADVKDVLTITIFPIVDPSAQGGARYENGRLILEIADNVDPIPTLLHEVFRAILLHRRESIAVAAGKCKQAIDDETLTEGLVYAITPGILHVDPQDGDPLAQAVADDRAAKRSLRRPQTRFQRLGLALRPLVQNALDSGEPLGELLPDACDAWKAVARAK